MGETWVIHRTCGQRIEEIENINVYRAIVTAIFNAGGPSLPGVLEQEYFFPDPSTYAAKIEAAPHVIAKKGKIIGESVVVDPGSVRDGEQDVGAFQARYEQIRDDLKRGLVRHNIDELWEGSAAEQFTDVYLPELQSHLTRLAKMCHAHKDATYAVKNRIAKAHDDLVREVESMVAYVVGSVGAVSVAAGAGAISTGPVGLAAGAVGGISFLIGELIYFHNSFSSVVSALNDDLASELLDSFDELGAEEFKGALRGVDMTSVSRHTWYPARER